MVFALPVDTLVLLSVGRHTLPAVEAEVDSACRTAICFCVNRHATSRALTCTSFVPSIPRSRLPWSFGAIF